MWALLLYILEWIIRVVMLFVVTRKRKPISAMAWLLVITYQPYLGLFFYLILGRNHLPNRRIRKYANLRDQLDLLDKVTFKNRHTFNADAPPALRHAADLCQSLCDMPIVAGNAATLITEPAQTVSRIVEDIDAAQKTAHLLFFIYADDESGRAVREALSRAVQRGVACRVLVDGVGSKRFLKKLAPKLRADGVEVVEALPVGLFRRHAHRIDLRTHRKIVVIDGKIAYTGSQNLINADYGEKGQVFYDLMMRLTGPIALELQTVFMEDWFFESRQQLDSSETFPPQIDAPGDVLAQTLPSGPNYPNENYQWLVTAALSLAEKEVTITTPYFVPDDPFLQALKTAATRGVHVQLIVPKKSNHRFCDLAARAFFSDLLDCGVDIQLFQRGTLHTKSIRIDDSLAFVGSSNFDIRSFALNFEINMLFYGPVLAKKLREVHDIYLQQCVQLEKDTWAQRPAWKDSVYNIIKLLNPLL